MNIINLVKVSSIMEFKLPTISSNLDLPYSRAIVNGKNPEVLANYLTDYSHPQGHPEIIAL